MLPLFKSHYSIGKSILTLGSASVPSRESFTDGDAESLNGPASIFTIANNNKLDKLVLVEDSLVGFLEAQKQASDLNIQLVFGLRVSICHDMSIVENKKTQECIHKIVIFAKNDSGCILLNKIYSLAFTKGAGKIDFKSLKSFYNDKDLKIAIPFYDSYLFHNSFSYKEPCMLDDSFFEPVYFIEDNKLPFDFILQDLISNYCDQNGFKTEMSKSVFYENREDFEAYQTYKCICNRSFSNKPKTLDMPNIDHCASNEFCFESYLDYESL